MCSYQSVFFFGLLNWISIILWLSVLADLEIDSFDTSLDLKISLLEFFICLSHMLTVIKLGGLFMFRIGVFLFIYLFFMRRLMEWSIGLCCCVIWIILEDNVFDWGICFSRNMIWFEEPNLMNLLQTCSCLKWTLFWTHLVNLIQVIVANCYRIIYPCHLTSESSFFICSSKLKSQSI